MPTDSITSALASWSRLRAPMRGSPTTSGSTTRRAPDYARTIDIHRKPGYDPAELFLDPTLTLPKARVAATLAKKALGFRYLMNVIPLDATLVRGSHGRMPASLDEGAVLISSERRSNAQPLAATAVRDVILDHLFN